jgi:hypothetical protein
MLSSVGSLRLLVSWTSTLFRPNMKFTKLLLGFCDKPYTQIVCASNLWIVVFIKKIDYVQDLLGYYKINNYKTTFSSSFLVLRYANTLLKLRTPQIANSRGRCKNLGPRPGP